jgi:serine protease Do
MHSGHACSGLQTGRAAWTRRFRAVLGTVLAIGLVASAADCAEGGDQAGQPASGPNMPLAQMPSFAPLVRKVLPAVVNVAAALNVAAPDEDEESSATPKGGDSAQSPLGELLHRFFELQHPAPRANSSRFSIASGFIIDPAGDIVTADHVVANADKVTVIFPDDTQLPARIIGRDALTDLALLKIEVDHPLPAVEWGDSDAAEVGDWVVAVGNPFGLGGTVSPGIISARGRDIHSGPFDDFLQIDASINRGNSGGPIFNGDGKVVGIATEIYTPSGGSVGIAFATPSNLARPIIEELRTQGRVKRGQLGVQIQEVTPNLAKGFGLPKAEGAVVVEVTEGGPAARAGIRQGDVILSFDGHVILHVHDLPLLVAQAPLGQAAAAVIWRAGREITLSPVVEELRDTASAAADHDVEPKHEARPTTRTMGLTLAPLTPAWRRDYDVPSRIKGVLLVSVADGSAFSGQDIAAGDIIVTIDQQPAATPRDVAARLRDAAERGGGTIVILVYTNGSERFVALSVAGAPPSGDTAKRRR